MLNEPRWAFVRPVLTLSTMTASRAMGDLQRRSRRAVRAATRAVEATVAAPGPTRPGVGLTGSQLDHVARAARSAQVFDVGGHREQAVETTALTRSQAYEVDSDLVALDA